MHKTAIILLTLFTELMIKLTNTLSGKKEEFTPIYEKEVRMYNCGPTVYDYAHIGNLRAYVFSDILRRTLEFNTFNVKQVINITDFGMLTSDADEGEDKMLKGLKREGKPLTMQAMKELGDFYTKRFEEDLQALNIKLPTIMPKASEHIKEDIELIETLEHKGYIYKTSDGLYFDTSKFSEYGKLGNITSSPEDNKARITVNTEKKNPKDFAVWKFNNELGFESKWGQGFPGWHIECSAMSIKYLGETFDIHTGGIDHIPVHHNNEIAQSEAATGKKFVNYWVHENHLNVDSTKISKSLGNSIILKTLREKGLSPLAYRYWLLTAHYKTPVNFTWEALEAAQKAYKKLLENIKDFGSETGTPDENFVALFKGFVNDDLDTPRAIALVWEVVKDEDIKSANKKATLFKFDEVLGLDLENQINKQAEELIIPEEVATLFQAREDARKNKDFKKSDELREEIKKLGFEIKDSAGGTQIIKS